MDCEEKMQEELGKREVILQMYKYCYVYLYTDKAGGEGQGDSRHPGDAHGGPGLGVGHQSRTCDTWYTVSPSSQEEKK